MRKLLISLLLLLLAGCGGHTYTPHTSSQVEKSPEAITAPANNHLIAAATWNQSMEDEFRKALDQNLAPKPFISAMLLTTQKQGEEIRLAQSENTEATTAIQKLNKDWGESETKWKSSYDDLRTSKDKEITVLKASLTDQTRKHYITLSGICFGLFLVAGGLGLWTGRSALMSVSALCAVGMIVALVVAQTVWLVPYIGGAMAIVLLAWGIYELVEHTKDRTLAQQKAQ